MGTSDLIKRLRLLLPESLLGLLPDEGVPLSSGEDAQPKAIVVEGAAGELLTLKRLQEFAAERIRAIRGVNFKDVMATLRAFDDGPKHPDSQRMLHELRTRAWGKTVLLRSSEGGDVTIYRIAQANYGAPKLGVINRQAPVAEKLVSVRRGDQVELKAGTFDVIGVAHLEPDAAAENFRQMDLDREGLPDVVHLDDVARALQLRLEELVLLLRGDAAEEVSPEPIPDVQRSDVERLGAHFYTRATELQERLMRSDEGLAVVIGVAGSGKTSVALGRTKMLVDRILEDDEPQFYRSETAIGFVLTGQLCDYLAKTCQQLSLYDMPVQEFHQLRARLFELRRLDEGFEQSVTDVTDPLPGTMAWLRAADAGVAQNLAKRMRDAVADAPKERETAKKVVAPRSKQQEAALERIWADMAQGIGRIATALENSERREHRFQLERLASRVDSVRRAFAEALERDGSFTGAAHRELRQNIRSALRERLVRALRLPDAYAAMFVGPARDAFAEAVRRELGEDSTRVSAAVNEAARRLSDRKLSVADVDALLALAHMVAIGYRGREDRDPISHLTEPDWYSQVFIDEFQDFNEVQLFLMAAQANPERQTVTVVGDSFQKLRGGRRVDLTKAFPWADATDTAPGVLVENKRQTGKLATLAQRFREDILGDTHSDIEFPDSGDRPRFLDTSDVEDAIYQQVLRLPRHLSIAVICSEDSIARDLERSLRDRLGADFRDTRHSKRGDLLQRFYVHFTTAIEAKGLEFDAAVVAGLHDFDLDSPEQANALYVALSRPRHALTLIGMSSSTDERLRRLLQSELIERAELVGTV
jgi:hypothetical protein